MEIGSAEIGSEDFPTEASCWTPAESVDECSGVFVGIGADLENCTFEEVIVDVLGFDIKDFHALEADVLDILAILVSLLISICAGMKSSTQCFPDCTTFRNLILICSVYFDGFLINSSEQFSFFPNMISLYRSLEKEQMQSMADIRPQMVPSVCSGKLILLLRFLRFTIVSDLFLIISLPYLAEKIGFSTSTRFFGMLLEPSGSP